MKISEFIRLGSLLGGQAFHCFQDSQGGTCAWGAAFKARGLAMPDKFFPELPSDWVWAEKFWTICPEANGCSHELRLHHLIAHLNDSHHWTREQIADWVQSIEIQQEAAYADAVISVELHPCDVVELANAS